MGAPYGNKFRQNLNTPELRQQAYKSYCEHLASGKGKKSWHMTYPVSLTWESMEKYIRDYPDELDPIHKKIAESKGYAYWESVVEDSAAGKNKDANTATLQMLMRNKYRWDRYDTQELEQTEVLITQETLLMQLKKIQDRVSKTREKAQLEQKDQLQLESSGNDKSVLNQVTEQSG